jgi:hypothetical protein
VIRILLLGLLMLVLHLLWLLICDHRVVCVWVLCHDGHGEVDLVLVIFGLVYVLLLELGRVLAHARSRTQVRHIVRVSLALLR